MTDTILSILPTLIPIVIGFLGILITLKPPHKMYSKYIWIGVFVVLAVAAITFSLREQIKNTAHSQLTDMTSSQTNRDIAFLRGQVSALAIINTNRNTSTNSNEKNLGKELANAFDNFTKENALVKAQPTITKTSLKNRALELSKQLVLFYSNREKGTPDPANNMQDYDNYNSETIRLYRINYQQKVGLILKELEQIGLSEDTTLDGIVVNISGIEGYSTTLYRLAQKL